LRLLSPQTRKRQKKPGKFEFVLTNMGVPWTVPLF
jgi:hypothetical protein